jgi:uncharacterized OsmC-like protein
VPRRSTADLSVFGVRVTAGSLREQAGQGDVVLAHAWTDEGVVAGPATNGAQVLHLSVALCVLNDSYREAERLGVAVQGVAVEVDGGFDDGWASTGIEYTLTVDSPAPEDDVRRVVAAVEEIAEIPRALRAGARVTRRSSPR